MLIHKKSFLLLASLAVMMLFLVSCSGSTGDDIIGDPTDLVPQYGGILKMAYGANPGTLDLHKATSTAEHDIGHHIAEPLYERCAEYKFHPDLASELPTVNETGTLYTIKLNQGIKFHNGKEMTAEDVVASFNRWRTVLPSPPEITLVLDKITAVDKYTVEIHLTKPHADFLRTITGNPMIYPKELCEKYGANNIPETELVGTGPYRIKEFLPDRHVHLVKYKEYVPRGEELAGRAGRKNGYVDEMILYILPDQSVRLMGVESGDFHSGFGVDFLEYERLKTHPTVKWWGSTPYQFQVLPINCFNPPTNNVKIRQAMQAAINVEPILASSHEKGMYVINCSKIWKDIDVWYSEAGCKYYNQGNPTLAKKLLEESGYNNEPIVFLGMTEYAHLKNAAIIAAAQLREAGFNVDLVLFDQGSFVANYLDKTKWNIASTIAGIITTPTSYSWTRDEYIGWWQGETPRKKELGALLRAETEHDKRFKVWEELQELSYIEVNEIWIGAYFSVSAASRKTHGWMNTPYGRWWNVWMEQ